MIDFIKIEIKNIDINRLKSRLDFLRQYNEATGESEEEAEAEYHFCKIKITQSGKVFFQGSIHKMYNSLHSIKAPNHKEVNTYRGYNGSQFGYKNIVEVRHHLVELLGVGADQMVLRNMEFGINTQPSFNPQLFIKGLLYHQGKPFEYRHNEHFAQAAHQRYYLKIYNKSAQYAMDKHTLRIEMKMIASKQFAPFGIKTIADISPTTLYQAKKDLLLRFDETTYYDTTIRKKGLTKKQKQALLQYSNPRYWIDTLTKQKRYKQKKRLHDFILKNSSNLHLQIRQNIIDIFSRLNCPSEKKKGLPMIGTFQNPKGLAMISSNIAIIRSLTHLKKHEPKDFRYMKFRAFLLNKFKLHFWG